MSRVIWPLAALLAFAACSGNGPAVVDSAGGTGGSTDGGTETSPIPDSLKVNLEAIAYDGTTLQVQIAGLDSTPTLVTFDRAETLDLNGYKAFKMQEDALDRMFVALAKTSDDGSVTAATVSDGGQFNRHYGGGIYSRNGAFTPPVIGSGPGAGQVSYAGDYVGVMNGRVQYGDPTSELLDPGTADPAITPQQSSRVSGAIFLNANFSENLVNGAIYDRVIVDEGFALDDVILVPTTIGSDGTFIGTTEFENQTPNGSYGGIFGGTNANSVAGVVYLTEVESSFDNEQEHGAFVLTKCGPDNTSPACSYVAP